MSVTKVYRDYIKTYIKGAFVSESFNKLFCNVYDKITLQDTISPLSLLTKRLFTFLSPEDKKVRGVLSAFSFLLSLYEAEYTKNDLSPVADSLFFEDEPDLSRAPANIQQFLVGTIIIYISQMLPQQRDYCQLYQKHLRLFGKSEWTDEMERLGLCRAPSSTREKDIEFIDNRFDDFFIFLTVHCGGKRLLIDLWATWCGPCIAEFKHYDEEFYAFLEKYKVNPMFISIDDLEQKETWQKQVKAYGLKGRHVLANPKLRDSIEKVVYEEGETASIPRYLIIDEKGVIRTLNAARPSSSTVRKQIESFFGEE